MAELKKVVIEPMPFQREGIAFHFAGAEIDASGEPASEFVSLDLIVPPLNLNSMKILSERLQKLSLSALSPESCETLIESLIHALRRNYKGVPRWLIEESVDVGSMSEMTIALMDVSGLHRKEIAAEKAVAAAQAQLTGT